MTKFDKAYIAKQFQELRLFDETNCLNQIFNDVVCIEIGKDCYHLPNGRKVRIVTEDGTYDTVKGDYIAEIQLQKVIDRGYVNLDYWVKIEEGPSLEERFEEEYIREREEHYL